MDDMRKQVKGFMKKVSFSSSSSGKFKGQGRVLESSSSSSGPSNLIPTRTYQNLNPKPTPTTASNSMPLPQKPISSEQNRTEGSSKPNSNCKLENGFDPIDHFIEEISKWVFVEWVGMPNLWAEKKCPYT
ncbi:hypothetical protein L6164_026691 [Bauhinia variegata]|uniref:Uncharacterized protein n=1 Tax=Bauhinia variegata TaxID=167791 RepID=A0ACB9LQP9_BAUVA|nr:hypothetical protein L6164_026691 [Bauhinia variegata]